MFPQMIKSLNLDNATDIVALDNVSVLCISQTITLNVREEILGGEPLEKEEIITSRSGCLTFLWL